ncbi:uncharacterized protein A4U43_C03F11430 [Asparagus officinalis]|uniref:Uncharacterized protein n=1 Tax=Asparagus officinalis TaxID=4686 RepID=A0A5P1F944_ASPOF|nr:pentatricopeptide repeat-containing protein At5g48910-like [Asparagus officinalis]ONK74916.1 uncharacterized protein A4U43_C03F11430 [Asparagus officinalis]
MIPSYSLASPRPLPFLSPYPPPKPTHTLDLPPSKTSKASPISHYNSLIRTHIESHRPSKALSLFNQLLLSTPTLHPDHFTFPLILKACAHLSSLKQTQQIHCFVLKSNAIPQHDVFILTSLINAYAECGSIDDARRVFDRMPERNTVTWNSVMSGLLKFGDITSAFRIFNEMPMRNIVSWNSLMAGYVKASLSYEAIVLFIELQVSGLKPDESTMVSLVSAISDLGLLDLGRRAHGYIARNGLPLDGALGVALITMYSKCGSIDASYRVFQLIPVKNVNHWSCIIGCLANHGQTENSLQVFSEMLHLGIRPNHITFVGVLNACRHSGSTEEGIKYFNLVKTFDIEPRIEHYGCLVDLLGRAGFLKEAMEIACNLSMDPGYVVWSTLLAACRNHGNVEIAETVAKKMIELDPDDGSPYVLISNIYAQVGRWEDFRKMRRRMEERRVMKVTGLSWIEVDGGVHEFAAGDKFHVKAKEIYCVLEEMTEILRWEGYRPVESADSGSRMGNNEEEDVRIESPIS